MTPTLMSPTHGMILAAGLGTRMRPLTHTQPKPMLKVADKPLIDWALDRLGEAGCACVVVNLHHLGEQIVRHLATHPAVTFVHEDPVLETGGGVKNALDQDLLGDRPFFVCNADNLWLDDGDSSLTRLAAAWDDGAMDALLLLHSADTATGYDGVGDFWGDVSQAGPIRRITDGGADHKPYVFTGVQLLHPRLFINAPDGAFSLNVLYDQALAHGRLYGLAHQGAWHHVGTPEALAATDALLKGGA